MSATAEVENQTHTVLPQGGRRKILLSFYQKKKEKWGHESKTTNKIELKRPGKPLEGRGRSMTPKKRRR